MKYDPDLALQILHALHEVNQPSATPSEISQFEKVATSPDNVQAHCEWLIDQGSVAHVLQSNGHVHGREYRLTFEGLKVLDGSLGPLAREGSGRVTVL